MAVSGGVPTAVAGDAIALKVVERFADNSIDDLPSSAFVTWIAPEAVTVLEPEATPNTTDQGSIPAFGTAPTAIFIDNAQRPERAENLAGVLFIVDAGTVAGGTASVTAAITGSIASTVSVTIPVGATPAGNAANGATLYATACASCHGATGEGSPANPDGSYTLEGATYDYPAPGLNAATGNLASDPGWNPALFAMASRGDLDDDAIVLRAPMQDWLSTQVAGRVLTTQDFADLYAYLLTQPR